MSQNRTEATPLTLIVLAEWDRRAPEFLERVDAFENANTSRLIKEKFATFRSELETNQDCDFSKFQKDCETIFNTNLPSFQVPPMTEFFKTFFKLLIGVTVGALLFGLIIMAQAEVAAFLGIITIATFNFKAMITLSAAIGSTIATLSAISMFRPAGLANKALLNFADQVTQKPEAATTTTGMTNA